MNHFKANIYIDFNDDIKYNHFVKGVQKFKHTSEIPITAYDKVVFIDKMDITLFNSVQDNDVIMQFTNLIKLTFIVEDYVELSNKIAKFQKLSVRGKKNL